MNKMGLFTIVKVTEIVVEGCASESDALTQARQELPNEIMPVSAESLGIRDSWAITCHETQ